MLVTWKYNQEQILVHHTGAFYKIIDYKGYKGNIKQNIEIDNQNDDSKGAQFYEISKLNKDNLSEITILELEKLGCTLK